MPEGTRRMSKTKFKKIYCLEQLLKMRHFKKRISSFIIWRRASGILFFICLLHQIQHSTLIYVVKIFYQHVLCTRKLTILSDLVSRVAIMRSFWFFESPVKFIPVSIVICYLFIILWRRKVLSNRFKDVKQLIISIHYYN